MRTGEEGEPGRLNLPIALAIMPWAGRIGTGAAIALAGLELLGRGTLTDEFVGVGRGAGMRRLAGGVGVVRPAPSLWGDDGIEEEDSAAGAFHPAGSVKPTPDAFILSFIACTSRSSNSLRAAS